MVAYTCDEACGQPSMVITAPLEPVCGNVIESGTGELKISDCLGNAGSVAAIGWKRARVQTHMTPRFRNRQARTVDLNFIPGRNYSVPPLVGDFQLGTAAVAGRCWSLLPLLVTATAADSDDADANADADKRHHRLSPSTSSHVHPSIHSSFHPSTLPGHLRAPPSP